jgi:hypothetical protein
MSRGDLIGAMSMGSTSGTPTRGSGGSSSDSPFFRRNATAELLLSSNVD